MPEILYGAVRNWTLLPMGNEGENRVGGREGRGIEWVQSEMLLEIRCGVYTAIIGPCAKFDSVYHNVAQRSRKMKSILNNFNISLVHILYDDPSLHLCFANILWA